MTRLLPNDLARGDRYPYELTIFDFDGTLADTFSSFTKFVNLAAERFRFKRIEEAEIDHLRGLDAAAIMRHLEVPFWKLPGIARYLRTLTASETPRLFDGVSSLFRHLRDHGLTIAIVSSNSADTIRRSLGPDLARMVGYFGCGASLFGKPAKLKTAMRRSGIENTRTIYIGDEIRDGHAAKAVHIAFGAVSWGYGHVDALRTCSPREVFVDMADLAWKLSGRGVGSL